MNARVRFFRPAVTQEHIKAVQDVLESGQFILGENVRLFEEEFAAFCGVKHCIGVGSGTDALRLVMEAHGIGKGDEVITVPNTFVATTNAIVFSGARPVFVDADPQTMNMDAGLIESAITPRTKAILPVHLYGQSCKMPEIIEIAKKHGLTVIEDACQAHGSEYNGKKAGSWGSSSCFSFFPSKNLGCAGDGGAVVTNDEAVRDSVRMLRDYGQKTKYHHEQFGYNSRLDAIQAAFLRVSLRSLDKWNATRQNLAGLYDEQLDGVGDIQRPFRMSGGKHVFYLYVIRTKQRDALKAHLAENGIETGIHYPIPIHKQKPYQEYANQRFPVAEKAANEILSLPIYPTLSENDVLFLTSKIKEFYRK